MSRFEFDAMAFLRKLLNPEDFGHAVTEEVRDEARILLGIKPILPHNQYRGLPRVGNNVNEKA